MDTNTQNNQAIDPTQKPVENIYSPEKNIYPTLRTTVIVLCFLLALFVAVFLIYQNGKTIYANGI